MAFPYKRVFAALDDSSTQTEVIERATAIAKANGAELVFGHVLNSVPFEATGTSFNNLAEETKTRLEASLANELAAIEACEEIPRFELKVAIGRVADTLLEALIIPCAPDLVICGERGFSNIKYTFIGSVSTNVIRNARCDVLVVKES